MRPFWGCVFRPLAEVRAESFACLSASYTLMKVETMAGNNTLTFTDSSWDTEVLNSEVPVLVDFWAEWCGPCRQMGPTVDAIAVEYAGRAKVGKLNVDENGGTAMRYNIRGIPTLLVFKGGQVVGQKVGAVGKTDVQQLLQPHI
jgi:thioredoxin 1